MLTSNEIFQLITIDILLSLSLTAFQRCIILQEIYFMNDWIV